MLWFVAVLVLTLLAAACGDDSDSASTPDEGDDSATTSEETSPTTASSDDETSTPPAEPDDSGGGELVISIPTEWETLMLDEGYQGDNSHVLRQVGEPLVDRHPETNEYVPALATSWERLDPNTLEFQLREGVTFHDGSEFNAEVAAQGLAHVFRPDSMIRLVLPEDYVLEFDAVGDYTLQVRAGQPEPLLLGYVAWALIPSAEQLANDPDSYIDTPIGTGPYRFVNWSRGESYELEAYEDWWGHDDPEALGATTFERVRLVIRPEVGSRIAGLEAGETDIAWALPPEECWALGDRCVNAPRPTIAWLRIDGTHPVLGDSRIALAINLAIDRATIGEQLLGGAPAAAQLVNDSALGFNPNLEPFPFDPDRARELIAEAIADGVPVNDDDQPLTLMGRQGSYERDQQVLEAIHSMLQDVGLETEMTMPERADYRELHASTVLPDGSVPPDRGWIVSMRHGNDQFDFGRTISQQYVCGAQNNTRCEPEIDALVEGLELVTDQEERDARMQEIAAFFADRYDLVTMFPLFELQSFHGVSSNVDWQPRLDEMWYAKQVGLGG